MQTKSWYTHFPSQYNKAYSSCTLINVGLSLLFLSLHLIPRSFLPGRSHLYDYRLSDLPTEEPEQQACSTQEFVLITYLKVCQKCLNAEGLRFLICRLNPSKTGITSLSNPKVNSTRSRIF